MKADNRLSPEKTKKILQILAANDPDFAAFSAMAMDATDRSKTLPSELLQDTVALLQEDPQLFPVINALADTSSEMRSFATGGEVAISLAVVYLFRAHIKIKRGPTGRVEFLFEHKPADSKLLTTVLKKLEAWFTGE